MGEEEDVKTERRDGEELGGGGTVGAGRERGGGGELQDRRGGNKRGRGKGKRGRDEGGKRTWGRKGRAGTEGGKHDGGEFYVDQVVEVEKKEGEVARMGE